MGEGVSEREKEFGLPSLFVRKHHSSNESGEDAVPLPLSFHYYCIVDDDDDDDDDDDFN